MSAVHAMPLPRSAMRIMPEISCEKGSLGSDVVTVRCASKRVLKATVEVLAEGFRKGCIDVIQGIAVFMSPSGRHESAAHNASGLVEALCLAQGIAVVYRGSARVSAGRAGKDAYPDESFLIGERAARYKRIEREAGEDAAETELGNAPPDLVIEVEHTHYDPGKADIYRAAGVTELWDLATGAAGHSPKITYLQANGGPQPVDASRVLPPVRTDALPAALAELKALGGVGGFGVRMGRDELVAKRLLEAASGSVHLG